VHQHERRPFAERSPGDPVAFEYEAIGKFEHRCPSNLFGSKTGYSGALAFETGRRK
jgi:hypothetical protein